MLAFAQASHGFIVAGVNEELETTNAFQGNDLAGANLIRRLPESSTCQGQNFA
jgi:hypothetical protein